MPDEPTLGSLIKQTPEEQYPDDYLPRYPVQISAGDGRIAVIDDDGCMWFRVFGGREWQAIPALPKKRRPS